MPNLSTIFDTHADAVALVDAVDWNRSAESYTYGALNKVSAGIADWLRAQGLIAGDRVAVLLDNSADLAAFYIACARAGITAVPINPTTQGSALNDMLAISAPKRLIGRSVDCPSLSFDPAAYISIAPSEFTQLSGDPDQMWDEDPDRLLTITFTSGTTSKPKAVCHRRDAMLGNAHAFNCATGLNENSRMMHVMPMSYMAGILNTLLSPWMAGGTAVIAPPFDARTAMTFWATAIQQDVNAAWLSPTIIAALSAINTDDETRAWVAKNMSRIFVGTAPLPTPLKQKFETIYNAALYESYGLSELLFISVSKPSAPSNDGSVGPLLDGIAQQIDDMTGEISILSDYASPGYLHAETGKIDPAPEWFPTGDIAEISSAGDIRITGRLKDIIIRGGMNVSPRAIEDVALAHTAIKEAAVVGTPHPFWGEAIVVFLVPDTEADEPNILSATMKQYFQQELPVASQPDQLRFVDSLPTNANGKVLKTTLREMVASPNVQ